MPICETLTGNNSQSSFSFKENIMRLFGGIRRYSIVIILLLGQLTFYTIVFQLPHDDGEELLKPCTLQLLSNSKKVQLNKTIELICRISIHEEKIGSQLTSNGE